MVNTPQALGKLISNAGSVVVIQADNPDTDSLASSLALEQILSDLGKNVFLYCGVDIPSYLKYLPGWDRVDKTVPKNFGVSIIVDTSSNLMLEQLDLTNQKMWLKSRPCIVIDHHHTVNNTITFTSLVYNPEAVATGEVIYELSKQLDWPLNAVANTMLASAILSDSLGLSSESTSARSIHILAELVEAGVNLPAIENTRRDTMRREPELVHYKGRLLQRVEYFSDNRVATVTVPWEEIETYSPSYNPAMLVLDDMRLTKGTAVVICFKIYKGKKITAKIRCNYGYGIGHQLAEHFGGGGHPYAAGFKIQDGRSYDEIKREAIKVATDLLDNHNRGIKGEAI